MIKNLYRKYGIKAEVRDYQERICEKTFNFLNSGNSVMIESPTGSGKSCMALTSAKLLEDIYPGLRVGWATMRRNNLAQAERENFEKGFNLDMKLISMFDKNPPEVDLLIVDEGHHDSTTSMNRIHSISKPKFVLGATATPVRSDKAALFFKKTVRDANTRFLVKQGYLAQFNHFSIPDWKPSTVADVYCKDRKKWGKSAIFFRTLEECNDCAYFLRSNGVKVEVVTGESDREDQLERFENGDIDVIINMMVLTEGYDNPKMQTVFCRPSSQGPTKQMAGRVMRRNGEMVKNIVQSADTRYEFTKEADALGRYKIHNGIWVPIQDKGDLMEQEITNSLSILSKIAQGLIDK